LSFEANYGQTDAEVDFTGRGPGYTVFLTPPAAVFSIPAPQAEDSEFRVQNSESRGPYLETSDLMQGSLGGVAVHMQLLGGNPAAQPVALEQLPGKVNYFIGDEPSRWRSNVLTYAKVGYQDVYPGIDVTYYGRDQQLEYDFIVSPGADPNLIKLNFAGADGAEIDPGGNLVLHTAAGDVIQQKPYLYQLVDGVRKEIAGNFVLTTKHSPLRASQDAIATQDSRLSTISFDVGTYDSSKPLIIDPLFLRYSSYLGGIGNGDLGYAVAADESGNGYVAGATASVNFPATPGAFDETFDGKSDAFVAKLNMTGSALVYATFLGGTSSDGARGIAIDADGNAYVSGFNHIGTFPTTPGAFDTTFNGGGYDEFVVKLSPDGGALVYSTYLGGSDSDGGDAKMAVDSAGNAYVTGYTGSPDFPATTGAFDTTHNGGPEPGYGDVFVTKVNASGSDLVYSTFLGGAGDELGYGLAVDGAGNAYVTGYGNSPNFPTTPGAFDITYNGGSWDGFVTKLNANGAALVYSTFLGGSSWDSTVGIAIDAGGSAYVTGMLTSSDFPKTPGAFDRRYSAHYDAFVTKLSPDGSTLVYSTFLGGNDWDAGAAVAVDSSGEAYVTGYSYSPDFPTTPDALDRTNHFFDVFVAKLNADGSILRYSTFLGGSGNDYGLAIALDNRRNIYLTGYTSGADFPTTPDAFRPTPDPGNYDAFVVKFHSR
jgi:hypothetical protein